MIGMSYIIYSSFRFFTFVDLDIANYYATLFRIGIVILISFIFLTIFLIIHKKFENKVKKIGRSSLLKIIIISFIFLLFITLVSYFAGKIYYTILNQKKIEEVITNLPSIIQINQKPISLNEKDLLKKANQNSFIIEARKDDTEALYAYVTDLKSVKNIDDLISSTESNGNYLFVSSYSKDSLAIAESGNFIQLYSTKQVYEIKIASFYDISIDPKFFSKDDRYFIFGVYIPGIGNFGTVGLSDDPSVLSILDLSSNKLTFIKHKYMTEELKKYWPLVERSMGPTADIVSADQNLYLSIDDIPQDSKLRDCFPQVNSCLSLSGLGYLTISNDEEGYKQLWYYSPSTKDSNKILDDNINILDFIKVLSVYPDK